VSAERVAELERLVASLAERVYLAHEVLANLAEGQGSARVALWKKLHKALTKRPLTTPDLVRLTGCTRHAVWRELRRMEGAGLVVRRTRGKSQSRVATWRLVK
jgi:biotin operon repressor